MTNFFNKLDKDIKTIIDLSIKNSISKPYFVGGTVRDYCLGLSISDIKDFDITTLSDDCSRLGLLFAINKNAFYKIFPDKHVSVYSEADNFDFSAGIGYSNVKKWMIENDKDINFLESFSRDFTINSMHQDLFSGEVFDPTGMGLYDIASKVIRTPAPVEIAIGNDKRRIFRAIKLSVQFGFDIDTEITEWVKNNYSYDEQTEDYSRTSEINKAMLIDSDKTYSIIKSMGLEKHIPLVGPYKDYIIRNNLVLNSI